MATTETKHDTQDPKTARIAVGWCLDETGSMSNIWKATIDGFNEYRDTVAKQEGETIMFVTKFSHRSDHLPLTVPYYHGNNIKTLPVLTPNDYRPDGLTPLYDAIGSTIRHLENWLAEQGDDEISVLFVVQTDGLENKSREFTREQIFDLIQQKENDGWRFVYLGADQDEFEAEQAWQAMGGKRGSTFTYDKHDTKSAYMAMGQTVNSARMNRSADSVELAGQTKAAHDADVQDQDAYVPPMPPGPGTREPKRRDTPNF